MELRQRSNCQYWASGIQWLSMVHCPIPCDSQWGLDHPTLLGDVTMVECNTDYGQCVNYTFCQCLPGRFGSSCTGVSGGVSVGGRGPVIDVCSGRVHVTINLGTGRCRCFAGSGYGGLDCSDCDSAHGVELQLYMSGSLIMDFQSGTWTTSKVHVEPC